MHQRAAERPPRAAGELFETDVPARLDRMPWSRFHRTVIALLGITWILDGLEVTLVGSISGVIANSPTLGFSSTEIGLAASSYVLGAVLGALLFGYLADRYGRKRLFTVTLLIYGGATALSGAAWDFASFALFRFLTGAGIGGEYSAINSAIQEFIPSRYRGQVDLAVNGSFWLGAAFGAIGAIVVLNSTGLAPEIAWRLMFLFGGLLALLIVLGRRHLPESPRWLMVHEQAAEAERVVGEIEARIEAEQGRPLLPPSGTRLQLRRAHLPLAIMVRVLFVQYARRAWLGMALMAAQAFLYNAIFFTYGLILTVFYQVGATDIGWYIVPFAIGNFLGPLLLGPLFDRIGRKPMITATYLMSGVLMAATGLLFRFGLVGAELQTAIWTVTFFFASAAASSAYLTVSEGFPLELRATAIAVFYALGTALGGIIGPALFGVLIASGSRGEIMWGYALGAALMIGAGGVEAVLGIAAERRSLESVAPPVSAG